jgi:hypothetical protein
MVVACNVAVLPLISHPLNRAPIVNCDSRAMDVTFKSSASYLVQCQWNPVVRVNIARFMRRTSVDWDDCGATISLRARWTARRQRF